MSSQKYHYYWRHIRDPLETHWRPPTCLIGEPSETDMPGRRLTCLIKRVYWVFDQAYLSPNRLVGLQSGMSISDAACWSLMGHVDLL